MSVNEGLTVLEMLITGSIIDRDGATEAEIIDDVRVSSGAETREISAALRDLYRRHVIERKTDRYYVPEWCR